MKFAICNEIFSNWTLPDTFAYAKKVGYQGVEIAPFTMDPDVTRISSSRRREIRDEAARTGIEITGIHWVLMQTAGLHLTRLDSQVQERTSAYLRELVAFCADLGGARMIVGSPRQRNLEDGMSGEEGSDRVRQVFRTALELARERGVVICLEPLAPSETNFLNTAAETIRLARSFHSPAMKMMLDVKAMSSETISIPEVIRNSKGEFAYFHANDRNLKGPGFGDVDFRPIAAALRDADYDGWVSVEVFRFEEGAEVIATRSREYLRTAFGK